MKRRELLRQSVILAMPGAFVTGLARAQSIDYPKPGTTIRYVVPFPPGGLTDIMARQVAEQLSTRWKINVVVENKPGGNAQIGADAVAKSEPDGKTLLAITMGHAANVTLFPNGSYNFQRDLRPVALLAGSPMLVVVPAASPIKDFRDLMQQSKTRALNAGSSGNGSVPHLLLVLFNELNQSKIQHIPYKGGAPSVIDLIGGQLDVLYSNLPETIAYVKSGKLRALAICSATRHPLVPDIPTTAEVGMPGLLAENWTAMMAPAAMPDASVNKLAAEVLQIMGKPEVQERASKQGFRVDARGPEAFGAFLGAEIERWGRLIKAADIRTD